MTFFFGRLCAASAYYIYNHFLGRFPSYGLRSGFLKWIFGVRIGPKTAIHMGCFITGRNIRIGTRTVINRNCYLDGRGGIRIGSDVSISPECYLISVTHDPQDPAFGSVPKTVEIMDRAWLGARVLVLPGIRIGEGAVIGAGSVVTRDVEPFSIVAGNPARKIGDRNRDLQYDLLSYFPMFDTDIRLFP